MRQGINTRKVRRVFSIIILLVMVALAVSAFVYESADKDRVIHLTEAVAFAVFTTAAAFLRFTHQGSGRGIKAFRIILNTVTALASPLLAVWLLQGFTLDPFRIYPMMLAANCVFYYLFYLLLTFVFGSFAAGYFTADILFLVLGIANYFVVAFRGSPIVPWDLFSLGTAALVANNYSYDITWRFVICSFGFLLLMVLDLKNTIRIRAIWLRIFVSVILAGGIAFSGIALQRKDVKERLGMDTTLFTPNVRYRNNGFLAAFVGNLHLINIEEPEGYSTGTVRQIQAEIDAAHGDEAAARESSFDIGKAPNIIVIMDEAFSDLQALGPFVTDMDYMPNFRALMEESEGGELLVSVKGGNTANTEFECLTGDTMAFLPDGSVVYQQFIRDSIPALPAYLASLGYSTTAIHPYLSSGWDRYKVYPLIGFEEFLSQSDFVSPIMMRNFISDESAFDKLRSVFEQKLDEGPQFIFEVTMQNHSGYSKDYPGFSEQVHLQGLGYENIQTRAAEKYLTLVYETDKALGNLMDYFKSVDEPTIVVMFGDHQPSEYVTNVITRLVGYDPEISLEEAQKAYKVPYFIWNNFGMEMEDRPLLSTNFIMTDILNAAGLPLTQYQYFLLDLQKLLPVVSGGAYVDTNGVYHSYDEKEEDDGTDQYENDVSEMLGKYQIIQYNHVSDIRNRVSSLFTMSASQAREEMSLQDDGDGG